MLIKTINIDKKTKKIQHKSIINKNYINSKNILNLLQFPHTLIIKYIIVFSYSSFVSLITLLFKEISTQTFEKINFRQISLTIKQIKI